MDIMKYPACSRDEFFKKYPLWEIAKEDVLAPTCRKILEMYYFEGHSFAKIDWIMGVRSRGFAKRWRNKGLYLLDIYHGYIEKDSNQRSLISN
jgi:hypothetical protein